MTKPYSWYNAALRRKKIAEAKRDRYEAHIAEMNRKANEQSNPSNPR